MRQCERRRVQGNLLYWIEEGSLCGLTKYLTKSNGKRSCKVIEIEIEHAMTPSRARILPLADAHPWPCKYKYRMWVSGCDIYWPLLLTSFPTILQIPHILYLRMLCNGELLVERGATLAYTSTSGRSKVRLWHNFIYGERTKKVRNTSIYPLGCK